MNYPIQYEIKNPFPWGRVFFIPYNLIKLKVIASTYNEDKEHVSVSLPDRIPSWDEMCFIKNMFFDEEEVCIQIHPRKSQYINLHSNCLHLWKLTENECNYLGL